LSVARCTCTTAGESTGRPMAWATARTGSGTGAAPVAIAALVPASAMPVASDATAHGRRHHGTRAARAGAAEAGAWCDATATRSAKSSDAVGSTVGGSSAIASVSSRARSRRDSLIGGPLLVVLQQAPQVGKGARLRGAHRARALPQYPGHLVRAQPRDHAQLEQLLLCRAEAGEQLPHARV